MIIALSRDFFLFPSEIIRFDECVWVTYKCCVYAESERVWSRSENPSNQKPEYFEFGSLNLIIFWRNCSERKAK